MGGVRQEAVLDALGGVFDPAGGRDIVSAGMVLQAAKSSQGTGAQDRSPLDRHNATLKKLVARGKERGYVTYKSSTPCCRRGRFPPSRSRT